MSKAYDRVEWGFVEAMMKRMGFGAKIVAVIMRCISTPSFSVVINGRVGGKIAPTRGLRQGCPLSPYLFLICAEGLSALIRGQERLGLWRGFACCSGAPKISHLLFADDSLLFCEASEGNFRAIRGVLEVYERGSGQMVNLEKSMFCCSPNVGCVGEELASSWLGIPVVSELESYLGLPVRVGRRKVLLFSNITDRVQKQLRSWRAKVFSAGGREVLIKAVVQAIPAYSMSLFKIPVTIISELHRLIARFWWGGAEDRRKIHWKRWELLARPKNEGGTGVQGSRRL